MKHSYFADENQLEKWVLAAGNIKDEYGLKKAFGYIMGEKFYNLSKTYRYNQERIAWINKERKKPGYNPKKIVSVDKFIIDLDKEYGKAVKEVTALKEILTDFSEMIKGFFTKHEIKKYFGSHIRLGALGHILTEKEHKIFIEKEVVEHSLETEINDSLILGDMMKYFNLN